MCDDHLEKDYLQIPDEDVVKVNNFKDNLIAYEKTLEKKPAKYVYKPQESSGYYIGEFYYIKEHVLGLRIYANNELHAYILLFDHFLEKGVMNLYYRWYQYYCHAIKHQKMSHREALDFTVDTITMDKSCNSSEAYMIEVDAFYDLGITN